jgi:hypothetical protein
MDVVYKLMSAFCIYLLRLCRLYPSFFCLLASVQIVLHSDIGLEPFLPQTLILLPLICSYSLLNRPTYRARTWDGIPN